VRWAAVEVVQTLREGPIGRARVSIGARRGANIGKVAAARKLLTLACRATFRSATPWFSRRDRRVGPS
jgi:hypothetical protein